jgi:hypothetical protein
VEHFSQFGQIVDFDFHFEQNRALIAFKNHIEAKLSISRYKFELLNYMVSVKPADQKRNIHLTKFLTIRDQSQP